MKRFVVTLGFIGIIASANCDSACALPPFQKPWMEKYAGDNAPPDFKHAAQQAKCNVCHLPGAPKVAKDAAYSDYGKAVRQFLKQRDYAEVKDDPEKLRLLIDGALQRAELVPSPTGKIFGDIIKAGFLP